MNKLIIASLLIVAALSISVNSDVYQFPSGKDIAIPNPTDDNLPINCVISTPDASDEMVGVQTVGTGSINGKALSEGQSLTVTVSNGDSLKISESVGATITITNKGASTVSATCDMSLSSDVYQFPSGKDIAIPNPTDDDLPINCIISTPDASDEMVGVQTVGTGSINGKALSEGQSLTVTVSNGDSLKISESVGATITITNKGASTVSATCDMSLNSDVYQFPSGKDVAIPNPTDDDLPINCVISTPDSSDAMTGVQTKGTGSINGKALSEGDSMTVTVSNGDSLKISEAVGAVITITNNGASTVSATCDV